MVVTPSSRRWPLSFSTPVFGLFSALVAFLFSYVYLTFLFHVNLNETSPTDVSDLSERQVFSLMLLCVSVAAALCGMLFWRLLMLSSWRWLATKPWSMTALFGSLVGLLEIICTPSLMWLFYESLVFFLTRPSSVAPHDLAILFPGTLLLGLFSVFFVIYTSKGFVLLIGIGASVFFALLARRIFS
jgi:hypothetical protein